jgi:hypothetical protein
MKMATSVDLMKGTIGQPDEECESTAKERANVTLL